jgi:hypothetical protein
MVEPTRWSAPRPVHDMIAGLDEAGLRRVIRNLTDAERDTLWNALVHEANTIPPADPREALLWHVQNERRERFKVWVQTLSGVELSDVYLRTVAGEDIQPPPDFKPVASAPND